MSPYYMSESPSQSKKSEIKECAWCAHRLPETELGEYEIRWRYKGVRDYDKGHYICIRCRNWMENLIQDKVSHTYMVIQARRERPCCGGSPPE